MFQLVVSPEFGDRVNLPRLTRGLIERMEEDLGTKLEWVAVEPTTRSTRMFTSSSVA